MTFVYLILWLVMSAVCLLSETIGISELYIGSCLMIVAEYIETVITENTYHHRSGGSR